MSKIALIFLFIFLFSGCATNNKIEIKTPQYPSWYLNPIFEDSKYLYGIGEGENINNAIQSAISSISSRLSLTISSTSNIYNKSYTDYKEYIIKESIQEIFSKTENIKFNNYEILNSKKIAFNNFIINLQIKKIDLLNSLTNELTLLNKNLNIKEIELLNHDPLTKYLSYKEIFKQQYSYINKVEIVKNLNKNFDEKSFYKSLDERYSKIYKNKNLSTFYIKNSTNNELISNKLKEELNKDFLILDNTNVKYKVEISSNINKKTSHGFFIVDNNITLKIYYENRLLKTKNYITKGVSSNTFDDAINNSYEEIDLNNIFDGVRDRI